MSVIMKKSHPKSWFVWCELGSELANSLLDSKGNTHIRNISVKILQILKSDCHDRYIFEVIKSEDYDEG